MVVKHGGIGVYMRDIERIRKYMEREEKISDFTLFLMN